MSEYRRFRHPGASWFFTVNLAERRGKRLLVDRIDLLRAAFAHVKAKHSYQIDAIVVLPDHLHCILTSVGVMIPMYRALRPENNTNDVVRTSSPTGLVYESLSYLKQLVAEFS